MYAFVVFNEDGVSSIVGTENIKFKKDCPQSFDIIAVEDTKEELELKVQSKRIRIPRSKFSPDELDTTTTCDEEDVQEPNLTEPNNNVALSKGKKKKPKPNQNDVHVENFKRIIKTLHPSDITEINSFKLEIEELKRQLKDLEIENDLKNDSVKRMKIEIVELKSKLKKWGELNDELKKENEKLKEINYGLQFDVIEKFKSGESPLAVPISSLDNPEVGERHNGNVHLGRGVWLPVQIFDRAMSKTKDTLFIKEIALSVFGEEILLQSSVSGQACNRIKSVPKPALDPTKMLAVEDIVNYRLNQKGRNMSNSDIIKLIHKNIRDKIQDLGRPPRMRKSELLSIDANKTAVILMDENRNFNLVEIIDGKSTDDDEGFQNVMQVN